MKNILYLFLFTFYSASAYSTDYIDAAIYYSLDGYSADYAKSVADTQVRMANQVYANSGLDIQVRVADYIEVPTDTRTNEKVAMDLYYSMGIFSEVATNNARLGTDIAIHIRLNDIYDVERSSCAVANAHIPTGFGWQLSPSITIAHFIKKINDGQTITTIDCSGSYILAHELAHPLGGGHGNDNLATPQPSYAQGYTPVTSEGMIGTVGTSPIYDTVLNVYSSPDLNCEISPYTFVPCGDANHDNVRNIREKISVLTEFMPEVTGVYYDNLNGGRAYIQEQRYLKPSAVAVATPVPTPTPTPVAVAVVTPTPTPIPIYAPVATPTPTPVAVAVATPTPVPTYAPIATPTPTPTVFASSSSGGDSEEYDRIALEVSTDLNTALDLFHDFCTTKNVDSGNNAIGYYNGLQARLNQLVAFPRGMSGTIIDTTTVVKDTVPYEQNIPNAITVYSFDLESANAQYYLLLAMVSYKNSLITGELTSEPLMHYDNYRKTIGAVAELCFKL